MANDPELTFPMGPTSGIVRRLDEVGAADVGDGIMMGDGAGPHVSGARIERAFGPNDTGERTTLGSGSGFHRADRSKR